MTSTPTQRLRLDKQATADNPDAWGERLNVALDLIDEAIAGFREVTVNGNVVLSVQNFASDQARAAVLRFTGAGGFSVTVPASQKWYFIDNRCTNDVVLKTAATAGSVVVADTKRIAYCDGATITTDTSSSAPPANKSSLTPAGGIQSTNVQAALYELDTEKAPKNNAAFTGSLNIPSAAGSNYFVTGNGDAASYGTQNARLRLHYGFGIETHDGTINGFYDARAGFWDTKAAPRVNGASVWHPGNFNPASYAPLAGAAFQGGTSAKGSFSVFNGGTGTFGGISLVAGGTTHSGYMEFRKGNEDGGARHGYIGFANSSGVINISSETTNGYFNFTGNYPRVDANVIWHAGNFNPANYAALNANVSFNRVNLVENGTGASLRVGDDATLGDVNIPNIIGVRGLGNANVGGFQLGANGGRITWDSANFTFDGGSGLYWRSAGNQGYNTVYHTGNFTPGNYLAKSGDKMTGNLDIEKADPNIRFHYPNVKIWDIGARGDGNLWFAPNGQNNPPRMTSDGNFYSPAFANNGNSIDYLTTYIHAVANARQPYIDTLANGAGRRINVNGNIYLTGSAVVVLDSGYNANITFPWAFSGVLAIIACNGDFNSGQAANATVAVINNSTVGFAVHFNDGTNLNGAQVRVNYHAVGF